MHTPILRVDVILHAAGCRLLTSPDVKEIILWPWRSGWRWLRWRWCLRWAAPPSCSLWSPGRPALTHTNSKRNTWAYPSSSSPECLADGAAGYVRWSHKDSTTSHSGWLLPRSSPRSIQHCVRSVHRDRKMTSDTGGSRRSNHKVRSWIHPTWCCYRCRLRCFGRCSEGKPPTAIDLQTPVGTQRVGVMYMM